MQNPALLSVTLPGGMSLSALVNEFEASQVQLEQPLQELSQQQITLSDESQAWSQISSAINAVQQDATALSTVQDLSPTSAPTSSNSQVVTASGTGASSGTYLVTVQNLAAPQITNSNTVSAGGATALGYSGTLTLSYGGNQVNVAVSSTDTLTAIAQNLQTQAASLSGLNLSASVLPASGGGAVLSLSAPTGSSSFSISVSGSNLPLTFTTSQTSQSASYTVNGVQNASSSNSIANALAPGVSMTLLAPTSGSGVTLSVAQDSQTVTNNVQKLVSDTQSLIGTLNQVAGKGGALEGNAALLNLGQNLVDMLAGSNQALPSGYQSLADLGLTVAWTQTNGEQVSLDQGTFTQALQANPSAVTDLFTGSGGLSSQITQYLTAYTAPSTGIVASAQNMVSQEEQSLTTDQQSEQSMIQLEQQAAQKQFFTELQSMMQEATLSQTMNAQFAAVTGQQGSGQSQQSGG